VAKYVLSLLYEKGAIIVSVDHRLLEAFTKYLDPKRKYMDGISTEEIGLVDDAPQSAIDAYDSGLASFAKSRRVYSLRSTTLSFWETPFLNHS